MPQVIPRKNYLWKLPCSFFWGIGEKNPVAISGAIILRATPNTSLDFLKKNIKDLWRTSASNSNPTLQVKEKMHEKPLEGLFKKSVEKNKKGAFNTGVRGAFSKGILGIIPEDTCEGILYTIL